MARMLPHKVRMSRTRHTAHSTSIVRWTFMKGRRILACEVRADHRGTFDVVVVPLWSVHSAVVESYDRAASAMTRHAEIAAAFRQAGWAVARQRGRTEVAA